MQCPQVSAGCFCPSLSHIRHTGFVYDIGSIISPELGIPPLMSIYILVPMPKYENRVYHTNRSTHNRDNKYPRRLLYDSERDEHLPRMPSRSRSDSRHSRRSSDSDQRGLSQAFLKDLCGAGSLAELEKIYPKEVAEFRAGIQPPKTYDPYHLTPLPVLTLSLDIAEEIRSSQKARREIRLEDSPALIAAKDALRDAELKDYAALARLEAVQEQLKKFSQS